MADKMSRDWIGRYNAETALARPSFRMAVPSRKAAIPKGKFIKEKGTGA